MILTDEKIPVSFAMLERANMTRGDEIGVPVDPADPGRGLRWKKLMGEMTDADFDAIEQYFLNKQNAPAAPATV